MPHLTWTMPRPVPGPVLTAPSLYLPLIACYQWGRKSQHQAPPLPTMTSERPLSTCQDLIVNLIRAGPWSSLPGRAGTEPGLAMGCLHSMLSIPALQKRDYAQKVPERDFRTDVTSLLLHVSAVVWQSFQLIWSGQGYDSGPGKGGVGKEPSCTP